MEEKKTLPYIEEYTNFIKNYNAGQVSAEQVGELVVRMAQYFAENNLKLVMAERHLSLEAKKIVESADESTGKPISVAKADILINATDQSYDRDQAKAHVNNIEQMINALKCLQKGIQNEYSHMGN
jgi:hypothetical protein